MNARRTSAVIVLSCALASAAQASADVFEEIEAGELSAEQEPTAGAAPEAGAAPQASSAPDAWAAFESTPRMRKVVVAEFEGKGALTLRQAVLDALSEHTEIEVIGAKDVAISAKGRSISPDDASGRAVLSKELGIYAWIDAHDGAIALHDARGKQLTQLAAGSHKGSDSELRVAIWKAFGPHVSDAGLRDHLIAALATSAQGKLRALDELRVAQVELATRRAERKAAHLAALKLRAESVLREQTSELTRQQAVAVERAKKQREELARQAELARQQELAQQQALAQQAEAARQQELAQQQVLAQQAEAARQQELAQQQERDAAYAKQAAAPAPAPAPAQRWQGAQPVWQPANTQPVYAQPQPVYAQPAPAPQPAPQPTYAAPAPQPAPQPAPVEPTAGAMPVSAATQAWLERRRKQQQH